MKKQKINKKHVHKGLLLLGLIIIVGFFLFQASDTQKPTKVDSSWSTSHKFNALKKWVPDHAEFIAVADISRLSETPYLRDFFEQGLLKGENQTIVVLRSLLFADKELSMLVFSGNLAEQDQEPHFNIIVQDNFKKKDFLTSVQQELANQNASLESHLVGETEVYWQKGMQKPFAFALPDEQHILIGTKSSLLESLKNVDQQKNFDFESMDSSFFGRFTSSANLQNYLPQQIASLDRATFSTDEQGKITIRMYLPDITQAKNIEVFLSGMKALYMLQMQNQQSEQEVFGTISISSKKSVVIIEAPLEELIKVSLQPR